MTHPQRAAEFLRDPARAAWHDGALWFIREKRDAASLQVEEWEELRALAAAIKAHTLDGLAGYLEQFERNARALGAAVHWARDAREHNEIVHGLLREAGVTRVVKSKSMLTEECGLNPFLARHGIEVTDTDLGERIVQLRGEPPSHIVLPAIHLKKEEVGELFAERLGTEPGLSDPTRLTEAARHSLRERFLAAQAGITGVNFAVAETGGITVCTNEGNADLGASLPPLHIACMGIEKVIPRVADLGVFLRLLARSATGQAITAYTSHFQGPRPDGALHIVLVDNGRSTIAADRTHARSLACIRCGACMNTCPVYRRTGGYSYAATIPGPIGSILEPLRDPERHGSLPFACSLCGSCRDVCPVKIDLDDQLLALRATVADPRSAKTRAMRGLAWVLSDPVRLERAGALGRSLLRLLPGVVAQGRFNAWARNRDLPDPPPKSFRQLHAERQRTGGAP